jgi:hypothetical protein
MLWPRQTRCSCRSRRKASAIGLIDLLRTVQDARESHVELEHLDGGGRAWLAHSARM